MKITIKLSVIITIVLLCSTSYTKETVRLTNCEWAPYFSEKLKHYGIGSRIVAESFALEGIRVKYGFYPCKRALMLAQSGDWDGAVGWEINPDREPYFYASDTVWEAPWVFFHLKAYRFDWKTFDDLKNIRIGGTLEYMYTPEFLEAQRSGKINVDRASSDKLGFKKLLGKRFEIFPQLIDIGYYQLKEQFEPETVRLFTHHPTPFGKHAEQLLLSKKHERNKRLIEIFNRGLQKLKESGRYKQYFEEFRRGEYINN